MPIEDDELLLRRIPVSRDWCHPAAEPPVQADAFGPAKFDTDGLSLSRAQSASRPEFLSIEQFGASGKAKQGYFVAVLRAGDLRAHGIAISEDPIVGDPDVPDNPGHVLLPQLNFADRTKPDVLQAMQILADELTLRVEGPFYPPVT
jgi:hypothetical protein